MFGKHWPTGPSRSHGHRIRADAEATEALARLTAVRAEHAAAGDRWQHQLDQAAETHREQTAALKNRVEVLTGQVEGHRDRLTRLQAEKDTAAAAENARRLEAEIAAAERDRAESARTEAAAARDRAEKLRAELRELRTHPSGREPAPGGGWFRGP